MHKKSIVFLFTIIGVLFSNTASAVPFSLGGYGAVAGSNYLSGDTVAPGRDYIDETNVITTSGKVDYVEIYFRDTPTQGTFRIKVWRKNGNSYDLVGLSNIFDGTDFSIGKKTATLNSPITGVQPGDLIGLWVSVWTAGTGVFVDSDNDGISSRYHRLGNVLSDSVLKSEFTYVLRAIDVEFFDNGVPLTPHPPALSLNITQYENTIIPTSGGEDEVYTSSAVTNNNGDVLILTKGKLLGGVKEIYGLSSTDGQIFTWLNSRTTIIPKGGVGKFDVNSTRTPKTLFNPSVLAYLSYYQGRDVSGVGRAGLATSEDGIVWSKDVSNPLLSPSDVSGLWSCDLIYITDLIIDSNYYYWGSSTDVANDVTRCWQSVGTSLYDFNSVLDFTTIYSASPTNTTRITFEDYYGVYFPRVIEYPAGSEYYYMFFTVKIYPEPTYNGYHIHYASAFSKTGPWYLEQNDPEVIECGAPGTWNGGRVYLFDPLKENFAKATLLNKDGKYMFYFSASPLTNEATSPYFLIGQGEMDVTSKPWHYYKYHFNRRR